MIVLCIGVQKIVVFTLYKSIIMVKKRQPRYVRGCSTHSHSYFYRENVTEPSTLADGGFETISVHHICDTGDLCNSGIIHHRFPPSKAFNLITSVLYALAVWII